MGQSKRWHKVCLWDRYIKDCPSDHRNSIWTRTGQLNVSEFLQINENIGHFLRPARSCLAMAGGLERLPRIWNNGILESWFLKGY